MTPSHGPRIVTAHWVLVILSFTFMALRFFSKRRFGKRFSWDDYIIGMAWMCLMIYSSLITASVAFGLGKRRVDIPPDDLIRALRCLYIGQSFLLGALTFSKASFAVTLLLLPLARWKRSVLWVSLITMAMVMALCLIFLFVRCSPVRKLWDLEAPGQCWNPRAHNKFARSAGAYGAAMDFLLAMFPSLIIWKLNMDTVEKVGVILAMSLGILGGVAGSIKAYKMPGIGRYQDFTYTSADLLIWACCEAALVIIAASIPFLRTIAISVIASLLGKQDGNSRLLSSTNRRGSEPSVEAIEKAMRNSTSTDPTVELQTSH